MMKYVNTYEDYTNEGLRDILNFFNPFADTFRPYRAYIYNKIANSQQYYKELNEILKAVDFRTALITLIQNVYEDDETLNDLVFNTDKYIGDKFNVKKKRKFINMGVKKFLDKFINEYNKMSDQEIKVQILDDIKKYRY